MKSFFALSAALALALNAAPTKAAMPPSCHMHMMKGINATNTAVLSPNCPIMRWKEWHERNPNVTSRYVHVPDENQIEARVISISAQSLSFNDDDPEPDPGFGQCGCDAATALAAGGCGWIHANIYQLMAWMHMKIPHFFGRR